MVPIRTMVPIYGCLPAAWTGLKIQVQDLKCFLGICGRDDFWCRLALFQKRLPVTFVE
jgi:hypothetical protein